MRSDKPGVFLSLLTRYRLHRRGGAPGPFFFTLGFLEPRGQVRLAFGGSFLRASRFSRLRSALSLVFFVIIG